MLTGSCWQDLQSSALRIHMVHLQNWNVELVDFWSTSGAARVSPDLGSHTLDGLRLIWEYVKMNLLGSTPQRCWFTELELGPATWIFNDLGRDLKHGAMDPLRVCLTGWHLSSRHGRFLTTLPWHLFLDSDPVFTFLCLQTLCPALVLLWFCPFLVHHSQPQTVSPSGSYLQLSLPAWALALA